ncbi:protein MICRORCHIDIA 7-like [Carica papaya]|uniref:protein MICRORCHIDIA 7-like n=1 Tax=Carica papaya TaxID=3649 RepID=UPI000B8CE467|nr:protein MICRORCHIDIA 7-like [Carica papaya]
MEVHVKQEIMEHSTAMRRKNENDKPSRDPIPLIQLSSSSDSDSDDDSDDSDSEENENNGATVAASGRSGAWTNGSAAKKRRKLDEPGVVLPVGFLQSLPPEEPLPSPAPSMELAVFVPKKLVSDAVRCKQFWKAGDYEGAPCGDWQFSSGGMDHVRVHPKFLHSNATSHKWALGAFAELLDNSLDEACNRATYVNIDMLESRKDGTRMLLIEDDGGGMDPDKMRHCMSLGYSAKSKLANTIGQYGNGFKTSTMRLGADVIVFSRCCGDNGKRFISLFLFLDYERSGCEWNKLIRSSVSDWNKNVETIVQWSPFSNEADLLRQFNLMRDHGTRIIIYNLWENDEGMLELDFDVDPHDIQLRGVNRDEKNIQMARQFPNSRHFLTYQHSLRCYASILYLRLPPGFRIILRGKDVDHHNIVNDMMMTQKVTYRPQSAVDGTPKDPNMSATVTIGFVKDAKSHIDVQGFNVYHKNRLIKPFWRLWNAAGSDGRGVIGVLEANFVEPAHDKQGFERTTVLARLESRLIQMQKNYWSSNCHKIGYAPRRNAKDLHEFEDRDIESSKTSPHHMHKPSESKKKSTPSSSQKGVSGSDRPHQNKKQIGIVSEKCGNRLSSSKAFTKSGRTVSSSEPSSPDVEDVNDDVHFRQPERQATGTSKMTSLRESFGKVLHVTHSFSHLESTGAEQGCSSGGRTPGQSTGCSRSASDLHSIDLLKQENRELRELLERKEAEFLQELQHERDRCKSLEAELELARQKIEDLNKEQESLIDIFSEERDRRDKEEDSLRRKLKDASNTIQEMLEKVKLLEKMKPCNSKPVR